MIDQNIIGTNLVKEKETFYFAHRISPNILNHLMECYIDPFKQEFVSNYKALSENNWELHKQFIKEGVNPNAIAKIIRNDEIEKLQETTSQTNFNFNQIIEPSLYERYSFINKPNVTLIDYAAFFGAIKCFKYLMLNGSVIHNAVKYAIAGGNIEIFHLCEQNNSSFEDAYKTAIKFHRNDIFKYIYENKIIKINNIEELGKLCIKYSNYEILSILEEEGMKSNESIICESSRVGNLFLVKHFLEGNNVSKDILIESINSGNVELVYFFLKFNSININTKNISLKCFLLISIICSLLSFFGIYLFFSRTPLIIACAINYHEIVKLLLDQENIDINAKDVF